MIDSYVVKSGAFEGPLDLLLSLIEKRKLFINDIALAEVTEDYITSMNEGRDTLDNISDFIAIASTLLLIKSKSLLPTIDLTEEESSNIEDLSRRLMEYQRVRELTDDIERLFANTPIFKPIVSRNAESVFAPSADISIPELLEAIQSVIAHLPVEKEWPKAIIENVMSLEEVLDSLTQRIRLGSKLSFNDLSGKGREHKAHVIIHFIALLELVKQGVLDARHDSESRDIVIETDNVSVPEYI